jgi:hypothetical protein
MTSTLQDLRYEVEGAEAPSPTAADRSNIAAYQKYFTGYYGGIMPEDEIRQLYRISSSGAVGEWLGHPFATKQFKSTWNGLALCKLQRLPFSPSLTLSTIGVTHDPAKTYGLQSSGGQSQAGPTCNVPQAAQHAGCSYSQCHSLRLLVC